MSTLLQGMSLHQQSTDEIEEYEEVSIYSIDRLSTILEETDSELNGDHDSIATMDNDGDSNSGYFGMMSPVPSSTIRGLAISPARHGRSLPRTLRISSLSPMRSPKRSPKPTRNKVPMSLDSFLDARRTDATDTPGNAIENENKKVPLVSCATGEEVLFADDSDDEYTFVSCTTEGTSIAEVVSLSAPVNAPAGIKVEDPPKTPPRESLVPQQIQQQQPPPKLTREDSLGDPHSWSELLDARSGMDSSCRPVMQRNRSIDSEEGNISALTCSSGSWCFEGSSSDIFLHAIPEDQSAESTISANRQLRFHKSRRRLSFDLSKTRLRSAMKRQKTRDVRRLHRDPTLNHVRRRLNYDLSRKLFKQSLERQRSMSQPRQSRNQSLVDVSRRRLSYDISRKVFLKKYAERKALTLLEAWPAHQQIDNAKDATQPPTRRSVQPPQLIRSLSNGNLSRKIFEETLAESSPLGQVVLYSEDSKSASLPPEKERIITRYATYDGSIRRLIFDVSKRSIERTLQIRTENNNNINIGNGVKKRETTNCWNFALLKKRLRQDFARRNLNQKLQVFHQKQEYFQDDDSSQSTTEETTPTPTKTICKSSSDDVRFTTLLRLLQSIAESQANSPRERSFHHNIRKSSRRVELAREQLRQAIARGARV